jgi:hypothetical protein
MPPIPSSPITPIIAESVPTGTPSRRSNEAAYPGPLDLFENQFLRRGDPFPCLRRGLLTVPPQRLEEPKSEVIAVGPRRLPPATHAEWNIRRMALPGWFGGRPRPAGGEDSAGI